MSAWFFVANFLLPVPLVLFALLSLPLPKSIRRGCHLFCRKVFDFQVLGSFRLLHIALFLSVLALLTSVRNVAASNMAVEQTQLPYTTPNQSLSVLSRRWRSERNLWISAFTLAAWLGVGALYREVQAHERLRDSLETIRAGMGKTLRQAPKPEAKDGDVEDVDLDENIGAETPTEVKKEL